MKSDIVPRPPDINGYFPDWYNENGNNMTIQQFLPQNRFLRIARKAANVTIRRACDIDSRAGDYWFVDWEIIDFEPYEEAFRGRKRFSDDELAAAFGLSNNTGAFAQWLIDRYGADSAQKGTYIRWRDFLNIPCPGTGHDGDPNVSIQITCEIQTAVRQLLGL